jgi:hypothetical protein
MSRTLFLVGYGTFAVALATGQLVALRSARWPTLGQVVQMTMLTRLGRLLLLAAWLWVGWHTFVRSDW